MAMKKTPEAASTMRPVRGVAHLRSGSATRTPATQ